MFRLMIRGFINGGAKRLLCRFSTTDDGKISQTTLLIMGQRLLTG
jgi:hypothetical protein